MRIVTQVTEFISNKLYSVLAVVVIIGAAIGYALYFSSSISPALQAQSTVSAQLDDAKKALVTARKIQEEPIDSLRGRVGNAQATRNAAQGAFFTDAQAAQLVDAIYQSAAASGVTIIQIETPITTTKPTLIPTATRVPPTAPPPVTSGPTPTGGATRPNPTPTIVVPPTATPVVVEVYRLKPLRLLVQGPSRQLFNFVSRIKETSNKSLVVNNLNITGGEGRVATLTMDLSVYTSAISVGTVIPTRQVILNTPAPTSAATQPAVAPPVPTRNATLAVPTPPAQPSLTPAPAKGIVIEIRAGGSAISLPYTLFTASSLITAINAQGGSATSVDSWDGSSWRTYTAGQSGPDFAIQVGRGYVVHANNASSWLAPAMTGIPWTSIKIEKGWSLLGIPPCKNGARSCYTASSLAAAINAQGGGVAQVSQLVNGQWVVFGLGEVANDFPILVGQGYFIRATKASEWTP